jgi:nicotinate-nucleotide pyrophosphorylase (carboxylating)
MKVIAPPPFDEIHRAVRTALQEDLAHGDVTTDALLEDSLSARGRILTEESIVVAGVLVVEAVFSELDHAVKVHPRIADGHTASSGRVLLELEGAARSLLMGERVALNFMQRLSGIATLTARFKEAVRGYRCQILDTRKTTPGLRSLEKWAVRLGGGTNHRQSLGDGILIKDNHLALLRTRGVDTAEACRLARARGPHGLKVIVETDTLAQVREALNGAPDVILLDNMASSQVRQAAEIIKGRALIEVSGGVSLANARELAAAGADYLSIGSLTHSAPAAPLSLEMVPARRRRHDSRR